MKAKPKLGRPPTVKIEKIIGVGFSREGVKAIDKYAGSEGIPASTAVRRIVEGRLVQGGYLDAGKVIR